MSSLEPPINANAKHFTISNVGEGAANEEPDVPALLRATAIAIERLGEIEILDMVFGFNLMTQPAEVRITVYFLPDSVTVS